MKKVMIITLGLTLAVMSFSNPSSVEESTTVSASSFKLINDTCVS